MVLAMMCCRIFFENHERYLEQKKGLLVGFTLRWRKEMRGGQVYNQLMHKNQSIIVVEKE